MRTISHGRSKLSIICTILAVLAVFLVINGVASARASIPARA